MSLATDYERAEAGRILKLHQTAIEQHLSQIKLLRAEIAEIKTKFPDKSDQDEIDAINASIDKTVKSIG